jgi:hypothetical protein
MIVLSNESLFFEFNKFLLNDRSDILCLKKCIKSIMIFKELIILSIQMLFYAKMFQ